MDWKNKYNLFFDSDFYGEWYEEITYKSLLSNKNNLNEKSFAFYMYPLSFKLWEDAKGKHFEYHFPSDGHESEQNFYFFNIRTERVGRYFRIFSKALDEPEKEILVFELTLMPNGQICLSESWLNINRRGMGTCDIVFYRMDPEPLPWTWNNVWHPKDQYSPLYRNNWDNPKWLRDKQARYEELLKVWNGVEPAKWKER
ncbi:hypothetical protein EHQ43_01360 [Leptospira bouyouniensis]|uniref:Uncharacterized protein n=1 Tax=Leptospira bouyouniensis TaxID=2484911 RepID=A0A7I0HWL8_9LEPT|nr:hypothetical protein [Leptospira bouyouniensis]TGL09133.1 hypothetical protein EHQ43_01360 [Leptospira bouyouniensis]